MTISGHWNLPFNENDKWNLDVSDKQRGRLAFKIQEKNQRKLVKLNIKYIDKYYDKNRL